MLKVLLLTGFSLLVALSSFESYARPQSSTVQIEMPFEHGQHVKRLKGVVVIKEEFGEKRLYLRHRTRDGVFEFLLVPTTTPAQRVVQRLLKFPQGRGLVWVSVSGYVQKPKGGEPAKILIYFARPQHGKSGGGVDSL